MVFRKYKNGAFQFATRDLHIERKGGKEAPLDQDEGNQASLADAVISRCRRRMHCRGTSLVGWLVGWLVGCARLRFNPD